ncbi:MAG: hypothetical protein R3C69_03970 [Geminicoccaceae bacterium]
MLGSQALCVGAIDTDWALAWEDRRHRQVRPPSRPSALSGTDQPAPRPAAYVELHIECGPLLERAGRRLAAFDRWWGLPQAGDPAEGVPAHTGPTPMAERKDALLAAAGVITGAPPARRHGTPGELHTSVGRIEAPPNSPNVVPSTVTIFAELRPPIRPCW